MSTNAVVQQRDTFVERLLKATAGVFDIFTLYIGVQLGFYRALHDGGVLTSAELAARTHTHERYVREWLEQQTVAGILEVEDERLDAANRRYCLPAGHIEVLIERDSLNYLAPLAQLVVGVTHPLVQILDAYRTGGGVPLSAYGTDFREGQAGINRPAFLNQAAQEWLPTMTDVYARLQADPPARVADIGCGFGWSSIGIAQHFPKVRVDGFDFDEPSIIAARANAEQSGVADRVRFHVHAVGDGHLDGPYDLVTAFECVHDMSQPVAALRAMRRMVGDRGAVLIADERVGDTFTAKGNDVEWMMYGWSVLHCLPVGMAEQPSAGTGTVMRADTLTQYATEAGFSRVEVLPIDNFFFRFYRLHT
ncbi:MAG: class I SAM-dependent methyltransferase [Anaerolineae bacterium]|nr:class I SAM-dependent methyltransferase [Anaerolineae bacterium]